SSVGPDPQRAQGPSTGAPEGRAGGIRPAGRFPSCHDGNSQTPGERVRLRAFLLDTNLLIALLWPGLVQHEAALKWFARNRARGWATCPMTQAGFVRIVSNPAFSRDAVSP